MKLANLKLAIIALALLIGLGGAVQAQEDCGPTGEPAAMSEQERIQEYVRLLECAKHGVDEARARLDELTQGRMEHLAEALLNQRDGLNDLVATRNQRIRELEAELAARDAAHTAELAARDTAHASELATRDATHAAQLAERDQAIAGKDRELEDMRIRIADLEKQIADLTQQIDDMKAQISTLEAERNGLNTQVGDLTASLKAANDQIAKLEADLAAANTANADLTAQLAAANQTISDLRSQLDSANQTNADLTAQLGKAHGTIADLTTQLNAANGKVANLQCRLDRLSSPRNEFFAALKQVLGDNNDIRAVGDRFVIQSEVWFDSGSAELKPQVRDQLVEISKLVRGLEGKIPATVPWVLQVNGHTDVQKFKRTPKYPRNNWELSVARALSVVDLMEANGVPGSRLAAAGFSEHQPIEAGNTPEAYRKNRRIELKLTDDGADSVETAESVIEDDCPEAVASLN